MSHSVSTALTCDHEDGCTASLVIHAVDARPVRREAVQQGWSFERPGRGHLVDLCPKHKTRMPVVISRIPQPRMPEPEEVVEPTPVPDEVPATSAGVWGLVKRAQTGDTEAFGLIYERYRDTIFRFIYFRVGNRPLAEDLTSDTFLRVLKRIDGFTWQGRDLGAWIITIARNLVADHFKSGRYRLEVPTGDVLDADREDRDWWTHPEAATEEYLTNVALMKAVKQLNPEQQECIVLRFIRGYNVAETAAAMDKNEGAVKALQYRAARQLGALLPDGFDPAGRTPLPMPYDKRS
jgi:RNA polymerase sigma-70 factor (ECF subfamily)